jgi:sodium-coupled neutral amino acid transporter 11
MLANRINISNYPFFNRGDYLLNDEEKSTGYEGSTSSYEFDEEFEMLVKAYMRDMNYTSLNQAALNVVYSLMNAGLVALPFVVQEAGIPLFIVVFIVMAILSAYTSIIVIKMANEKRVRTLEDLADCAFGLKGFFLVSICQIIFSFSLMCITMDIWADIMSDVFTEIHYGGWFLQNRIGQVIFGGCLVLPFCLLKKSMSSLRWTSYITVFAAVFALMAVVATYVTDNRISDNIFTNTSAKEVAQPKTEWWSVIYIALFCYSCNQKVFIIYSSLRRRSAERWKKATFRANTTVTLIYIVFGISGYLSKQRKDIHLGSFNFFMDNSDERKEVFDPAR